MIHPDRITTIFKSEKKDASYVLYWMQQSARVSFNHALLKTIEIANQQQLPVLVVFSLTYDYLDANLRHYTFMLEGLKEVKETLNDLGITFHIALGKPEETLLEFIQNCHTLVMDHGYLKPQKLWRRRLYEKIEVMSPKSGLIVVESDVIVPVKKAYEKLAYGAYVVRSSIMRKIASYRDFKALVTIENKTRIPIDEVFDLNNIKSALSNTTLNQSVKPYETFSGGYSQALKHLEYFFKNQIKHYDLRSDPGLNIQSYMSMYLHFGQICSLEIYEYVTDLYTLQSIDTQVYEQFIEQLIVRRELAFNFVTYNKDYDLFDKMTEPWAYQTMEAHREDERKYLYTKTELEQGLTHDPYFNSAAKEMRITGFMANYMRMYWAKKIMEWTESMPKAYENIVYLNNKYFLDGRDANSYVNIAWCFGKMDRAFTERYIFGKLRYMNDKGLERKFDMDAYVKRINQLKE